MITISLMGQLQTADGERDLACHIPSPMSVRQVIQRQGFSVAPSPPAHSRETSAGDHQ